MSIIIIYITHSSAGNAKKLCDQLIEERLVACSNIFPISSAYWWQGAIVNDNEVVSIVKTTPELWETVENRVTAVHPYEVPAIIKMDVVCNEAYGNWIRESTKPSSD